MAYAIYKIMSLKTEEDFKYMIPETNQGSIVYYQCRDYLLGKKYYFRHKLRKNGVIALRIHFEFWFSEHEDIPKLEKWKAASYQWALTYLAQGEPLILYGKAKADGNRYLYDLCFTAVEKSGKLCLSKITHYPYKKRDAIDKSYSNLMASIFGTKSVNKRIKKELGLCEKPEEFTSEMIPAPLKDETSYEYAVRVRNFMDEKESRIKELESRVSELTSERTKLTERDKAAIAIADKYSDFRTLRSDLIMGRRMNACKKYYADQGDKDTVKYIDTLNGYGKTILEPQENN